MSKIWKFDPWSHLGQKDRIEIFGRGAAKMGKKSWRDTFGTTGVKFGSEILSPAEKLGNFTHLVAPWSKRPIRNFRGWAPKLGKES